MLFFYVFKKHTWHIQTQHSKKIQHRAIARRLLDAQLDPTILNLVSLCSEILHGTSMRTIVYSV